MHHVLQRTSTRAVGCCSYFIARPRGYCADRLGVVHDCAHRFNADARFSGAYSSYRNMLRKQLPVMVFTTAYSNISGVLAFVSIAIYILYMHGFQSTGESFANALTASAYLAGFSNNIGVLAALLANLLPTLGIFQRISNGLQKLKDVFNTYEQFDARYACALYALPV